MKKILVTGSAGFLGWNTCIIARNFFDVTGIQHRNTVKIDGVSIINCDLRDFTAVKKIIESVNPDMVIHTAAASDPNFCQQNQIESDRINVEVPEILAEICAEKEISYVFTSTDLVFDGQNPPYSESSQVNPLNYYGEQKARAEMKILSTYNRASICRMPLMFGDTPHGSKRFLQIWIEQILAGKELTLFVDEFRTPVSAINAAQGLLLAGDKVSGLLHLGGHERLSRYEFGMMLIGLMNRSETLIRACSQNDVKMAAPRPKDVSLNSSKAFELGYNPGSIISEMQKLKVFSFIDGK